MEDNRYPGPLHLKDHQEGLLGPVSEEESQDLQFEEPLIFRHPLQKAGKVEICPLPRREREKVIIRHSEAQKNLRSPAGKSVGILMKI